VCHRMCGWWSCWVGVGAWADVRMAVGGQVCDAMKCIHEHDIIHRDLKPQNIIYQEKNGTVKLCDFGLARLLPGPRRPRSSRMLSSARPDMVTRRVWCVPGSWRGAVASVAARHRRHTSVPSA
jgi:serine/threonine protein kinase